MKEARQLTLKQWLIAIRGYSLPASIVPVIAGAAYARYAHGAFSFFHLCLALTAGMLYHVACNLLNDYFDFRYGVDRPGTYGGSGMLVSGALSPELALRAALFSIAAATIIGLYFAAASGAVILLIGISGLFGAVFYTAGSRNAKYNALGEPLVFLMMGVLMVGGSFVTQTGFITVQALLSSLPIAFLVTAILQANDTRDIADDKEAKIITLAILFGAEGARIFYYALLAAAYLSAVLLIVIRIVPPHCLAALLSAPLALRLAERFRNAPGEKNPALLGTVEDTAKLHLLFGMLFTAGLFLA